MSNLSEYLPFLIPLAIIEIVLAVTALIHVLRHPNYRFGNKVMWIVVVLILEFIGPIVYFTIGRGDE
ncbi:MULTISPECIES: PLD nuclease N-terminal domain-containing protein [Clostridium]|uniref:PLD nuclease N-terminal domain-containing protein n=1 Tax=Clostridium TaxID=1485 RepID=UPI000A4B46CB|nr:MULTISPECIES: PLD nuclease N-terminal domain-containing protein [Clostridium]MCD2345683.1 PLD nuclease N-terminal domain-containing protein [Clostridium guangxiense]